MRLRGGGDGVCAEWEVAADVRKEQTFFFFFYSVALIYWPPMWTWWEQLTARGFVIAANLDETARLLPVVEAVFQVSLPPEKIHRVQTDSVMIAPPDERCFPISRDKTYALNLAHWDFTWQSKPGRKISRIPRSGAVFKCPHQNFRKYKYNKTTTTTKPIHTM